MEKAVTYVGNSVAIVLERTICAVMGIGPGSIVKLSFEGDRLVIERTGKQKRRPPRMRKRQPLIGRPPPDVTARSPTELVEETRIPIRRLDVDRNGDTEVHLLEREHGPIATELIERYDLNLERMNRLHHAVFTNTVAAMMGTRSIRADRPDNIVLMRRYRFIYEHLERRDQLEHLIDVAIARWPYPSKPAMSAGSGADAETTPPSG